MTAQFRYQRSLLIAAPAEAILPEIADLRRHELWSPFAKPDPKTLGAYAGGPGAGQSYTWAGAKAGHGRIRIDAVHADRVVMTLEMRKPMKATNTVEFTLASRAGGVEVTWAMFGKQTLLGRLLGLVVNCDAMCGNMVAQGLAELKTLVETGRPSHAQREAA